MCSPPPEDFRDAFAPCLSDCYFIISNVCFSQGHVAGYPGGAYNATVVTRTAGACYPSAAAYPPTLPQSYPVGCTVNPSGVYVAPTFPAPAVPPPSTGYPVGYAAPPPYALAPGPPPGKSVIHLSSVLSLIIIVVIIVQCICSAPITY